MPTAKKVAKKKVKSARPKPVTLVTLSEAEIEVIRSEAFEEGFDEGREEGYDHGHSDGYDDGLDEGRNEEREND